MNKGFDVFASLHKAYIVPTLPKPLYLAEDAVHDPVDAGGADAVHGADAALLQVFYDVLYEGKLYVFGVLDAELLTALLGLQYNGFVCEDGEVQLPAFAD